LLIIISNVTNTANTTTRFLDIFDQNVAASILNNSACSCREISLWIKGIIQQNYLNHIDAWRARSIEQDDTEVFRDGKCDSARIYRASESEV
jgi:hypothetical protein